MMHLALVPSLKTVPWALTAEFDFGILANEKRSQESKLQLMQDELRLRVVSSV